LAVLKTNPVLQLTPDGNSYKTQKSEAIYNDILKSQNGIQNNFDDLNSISINTKVENGYVTINGTFEKKNEGNRDDEKDKLSSQYSYKSTFNRAFPLPENVNVDKMQMTPEKNKIILKFPKVNV